ncbi:MAG: hypothetical protein ABJB11_17295 [Ferruginibacter sp.]
MNQGSIYNEFLKVKQRAIVSFVKENIVDGSIRDKENKQNIYLATNGSWQEKYLSLYEVLHDKYVAKYLAQALLDKYVFSVQEEVNKILATSEHGDIKKQKVNEVYANLKFNKIVTVTVSSQLVGVALRELIRENDKYSIFINSEEPNKLKASPTLTPLSSYYSFDEEKPFTKIQADDNVIIVNDVISTGNLIYDLIGKIKNNRFANVKAVFSIADTRIDEANIKDKSKESVYIWKDELLDRSKFFSLTQFSDGIDIRKFKRPHPKLQDLKIKRINPLLNSIVELKSSHSEERRILFPAPEKFVTTELFKEEVFKVGHFLQNLTHNGYLTDMHSIFACDENNNSGEMLLNKLKNEIKNNRAINDPLSIALSNINLNTEALKKWDFASDNEEEIELINKTVSLLKEKLSSANIVLPFSPDYIFYPVFSGIEQLNHSVLSKTFDTHLDNIIGLQRFDTNKGWRFPFPAKRFNHLTKNKSILILDSGSLTGESLVQLIDTIAFLDVREITVLSVIVRIEDFYREFYSKLKSTKVKLLRPDDNAEDNKRENIPEHIIPLNILFGINLHIPVYPSSVSCPFCKELEDIEYYEELSEKFTPSLWTKNYLTNRKIELKRTNLGLLEEHSYPSYVPLKPEDTSKKIIKAEKVQTAEIDAIEIFLMRDRLGKIESYRFYPEYFTYFDDILDEVDDKDFYKKETTKKLELILTVILHEPRMLETIKDLLIDIKDYCQKIVVDIAIDQTHTLDELYYKWPRYSLLRLASIFLKEKLFTEKTFEKLFEFALNDNDSLNYLSFILWKGFFKVDKKKIIETKCTDILLQFAKKLDVITNGNHLIKKGDWYNNPIYNNDNIRDLVKDITEHLKNTRTQDVNEAYYNLLKFFISMSSKDTHDELSRFITRIAVANQNEKTDDLLRRIYHDAGKIISFIKRVIYDNLSIIKQAKELVKLHETNYETLFSPKDSIYSDFELLHNEYNRIKIPEANHSFAASDFELKLRQVVFNIEDFQSKYLLKNKFFYDYIVQYRCKLTKCIHEAYKSPQVQEKLKQRNGFDCKVPLESDLYINAHEELLTNAFIELMTNASNVNENDNSNLEFSIIEEDENIVRIRISQKAPFDDTKAHRGGYHKEVIPVLRIFGGKDSLKETKEPSFILEVNFMKHILNNF